MLRKLLKQEIKATARTFLPIYFALLILTVVAKLLFVGGVPDYFEGVQVSNPVVNILIGVTMTLYFILLVGLSVMTMVVIVQRFYKNFFTDEGYLMFTLPVRIWQQILSKLLVGLIWTVICGLTIMLSVFILSFGTIETFSMMEWTQALGSMYAEFNNMYGISLNVFVFEIGLMMIAGVISSILMIYASIAIGQLFNRHRIIASFGAYIAITIVLQIIVSIALIAVSVFGLDNLMSINNNEIQIAQIFINGMTGCNILLSGIFFFFTQYILKTRLNLE